MMRLALTLISAALLLSGCGTIRSAFGTLNDTIEKNQAGQEVAAPDAPQEPGSTSAQSPAALDAGSAVVVENIKKAAKRTPGGLIGDNANAAHAGDPIPPQ